MAYEKAPNTIEVLSRLDITNNSGVNYIKKTEQDSKDTLERWKNEAKKTMKYKSNMLINQVLFIVLT